MHAALSDTLSALIRAERSRIDDMTAGALADTVGGSVPEWDLWLARARESLSAATEDIAGFGVFYEDSRRAGCAKSLASLAIVWKFSAEDSRTPVDF